LISYQTYAIEPIANFDKIICKPNPYVIPSSVNVKIDGLVENSTIKIITLNGEVINEFDSPGGRIATWNGTNKKGELVPSGIYIIVAFNKDASKVGKGKIAIIRK
jgi:flagellar hook assembly protein FlgD